MPARTLMIGRHSDCNIVLRDETVSRFHAELVITEEGRYFLVDRNSMRGTWRAVDGSWLRLKHSEYVNPDDRIKFGEVETKLRDVASGA